MRALLLFLATAAFAYPALADHCETYSTNPAVSVGAYYVDEDCYLDDVIEPGPPDDCLVILSLWIYEESNGIPGLQREDEVYDDTCHRMIEGDTIIY